METTRVYVVQRKSGPGWLDVGAHADLAEAVQLRDRCRSWAVVRIVERTETVIES